LETFASSLYLTIFLFLLCGKTFSFILQRHLPRPHKCPELQIETSHDFIMILPVHTHLW
jgi:hypothetical protein